MIGAITLNPSIDQHILIKKLIKDDAIRAISIHRDPGGKGINVARVLTELGGTVKAYGIVGGCAGYMLRDLMDKSNVSFEFIEILDETRINIIITDKSDHSQTRISAAGPNAQWEDVNKLFSLLKELKPFPKFWALGGSLPPGLPPDTFKRIIALLNHKGAKCVLDADGEALSLGIESYPFLIKPNEYELSRLINKSLNSEDEIIKAAELLSHKAEYVLVSLGPKGAILARKGVLLKAITPSVEVKSKVGAGDSLIAGLLLKLEEVASMEEAFIFGVACGTAAVLTEGTKLCSLENVNKIYPKVKLVNLCSKTKVKDLVCGMEIDKNKSYILESSGSSYYFCSLICKEKFKKEPERYLKRQK